MTSPLRKVHGLQLQKKKLAKRTFVKVKRKKESEDNEDEEPQEEQDETSEQPGSTETSETTTSSSSSSSSTSSFPSTGFNAFAKLMNPDNWECVACEVSNKPSLTKCAACERPRDKPSTTTTTTSISTTSTTVPQKTVPSQTKTPAPSVPSVPPAPFTGFNAFAALIQKGTWECSSCEVRNKEELQKCGACETPKPDTTSSTTTNEETSTGFTFGSDESGSKTSEGGFDFSFGGGSSEETGGLTFGGE